MTGVTLHGAGEYFATNGPLKVQEPGQPLQSFATPFSKHRAAFEEQWRRSDRRGPSVTRHATTLARVSRLVLLAHTAGFFSNWSTTVFARIVTLGLLGTLAGISKLCHSSHLPMGVHRAISLALAFFVTSAVGAPDLFEGFGAGWSDRWEEKHLFRKPTSYEVADEGGRRVLHAVSRAAHGGMFRRIDLAAPESARLRWQWKVRQPIEANRRERERPGDDFAARVMVIFEESIVPLRTRALAYVWAAHEPMAATFPNPFSKNVGMVVVRTGAADAGRWLSESRDLVADYRAFFGEPPRRIAAVAVLVDTDNTGLEAEAWFAELSLESTPPSKP